MIHRRHRLSLLVPSHRFHLAFVQKHPFVRSPHPPHPAGDNDNGFGFVINSRIKLESRSPFSTDKGISFLSINSLQRAALRVRYTSFSETPFLPMRIVSMMPASNTSPEKNKGVVRKKRYGSTTLMSSPPSSVGKRGETLRIAGFFRGNRDSQFVVPTPAACFPLLHALSTAALYLCNAWFSREEPHLGRRQRTTDPDSILRHKWRMCGQRSGAKHKKRSLWKGNFAVR